MTFTEAAALVLRLVGKPLHYKEITDVAIERNLLSHVGKSPEVTMGARLNALIKKTDKDNPLVRVKPGVFALRDWDEKMIEDGLNDRTPAIDRISEEALRSVEIRAVDSRVVGADGGEDERPAIDDSSSPPDEEEKHRAELSLGATELFASEDDDDKPIFGSEEEPTPALAADEDGDAAGGKRRRRRRRGRGRPQDEAGGEEMDDDLPTYTVSDAGPEDAVAQPAQQPQPRERGPERERERRPERGADRGGDRGADRGGDRGADRGGDRGGDRGADRGGDRERNNERGRGDRDRDRGESGRGERNGSNEAGERELGSNLEPLAAVDAGAELAEALDQALASYERSRGPVAAQNIADNLRRKWQGDGSLNAAALLAVAQADNLRAERQGKLPRFRVIGNKLAPTHWSFDKRSDEKQKAFLRSAEQLRELTRISLAEQLAQLPHRAVGELVLVLLDRMGMIRPEFLKRPGAHGSEIHLSASLQLGGVDSFAGGGALLKTAIVIRRDGRDVGRERVTELRGALHHYGPAAHGWLITTGQVLSGAREEAASSGASPLSLTGRNELSELCLMHGVGVRALRVEVPTVDLELFEGLSGR